MKLSLPYENVSFYTLKYNCNTFYEHITEIKLMKTIPNSNCGRHVLKNNYDISCDLNKDLEILNT